MDYTTGIYICALVASFTMINICTRLYSTIPEMAFGRELFGLSLFKDIFTVNTAEYESFEIDIYKLLDL